MFKKSCDICLKMNRVRGKKIANDSSFEIREFEGISSSKQFFLKNIYWVKAGKSFVLTFTRFFKFAIIRQFSSYGSDAGGTERAHSSVGQSRGLIIPWS